jgi:hypothetical protein
MLAPNIRIMDIMENNKVTYRFRKRLSLTGYLSVFS